VTDASACCLSAELVRVNAEHARNGETITRLIVEWNRLDTEGCRIRAERDRIQAERTHGHSVGSERDRLVAKMVRLDDALVRNEAEARRISAEEYRNDDEQGDIIVERHRAGLAIGVHDLTHPPIAPKESGNP